MRVPGLFFAVMTLLFAAVIFAGKHESVNPLVVVALAAALSLAAIGMAVLAAHLRMWRIRREIRRMR